MDLNEEAIKKIWEANEDLWNQKIIPVVLDPLERDGGLNTTGLWEHILATAFGNSLKTFESIQLLCSPSLPRLLWEDAFILTRRHYETFITLEWIAQDSPKRAILFLDEYWLKSAHFLDLGAKSQEDLHPEKLEEIYRERDEVLKRHSRGPGALHLLPKLEERVNSLVEPLKTREPNLAWEYAFYYRDVSGFAHPSGWGSTNSLSYAEGSVPVVGPENRIGLNAVLLNGSGLFRIMKCWNRTFKEVSDETVEEWHQQWQINSGVMET
jgi:hypothetical protein